METELREQWNRRTERQAANARAAFLRLAESRDFATAQRLVNAHSELASKDPSLQRLFDRLPVWLDAWRQTIKPACELARSGRHSAALSLLAGVRDQGADFPGLDQLQVEWQARLSPAVRRKAHWDGLFYVQFPNRLWMPETPVTVQAFTAVMRERSVRFFSHQRPLDPIVERNFYDALSYCHAVDGRLPDSESWELAAQGRPEWEYPWVGISRELAHYETSALAEVARYPPTPTGFYDVVGNVWEWCSDERKRGRRVFRGGSFRSPAAELRIRHWRELEPQTKRDDVGFRCLLEREPG